MGKYGENLSLLAIGFGFASISVGVFGSLILSARGSTLGNTFFVSGFILFIVFIALGSVIRYVGGTREPAENSEGKRSSGESGESILKTN